MPEKLVNRINSIVNLHNQAIAEEKRLLDEIGHICANDALTLINLSVGEFSIPWTADFQNKLDRLIQAITKNHIGWIVCYALGKITSSEEKVFSAYMDTINDGNVLQDALANLSKLVEDKQINFLLTYPCLELLADKIFSILDGASPETLKEHISCGYFIGVLYGQSRPKCFKSLKGIMARFLEHALADEPKLASSIYDSAFSISWANMDSFTDQAAIRDTLVIPASRHLSQLNAERRQDRRYDHEKKRVCYCAMKLSVGGGYANGRSLFSYLKAHAEAALGNFDFYLYVWAAPEAKTLEMVKRWGFTVRVIGSMDKENTALNAFKEDEIDIVIHEMYWWDSLKLFSLHPAAVQVYLSMGFTMFESVDVDYVLAPEKFLENELYPLMTKPVLTHPSFVDKIFVDQPVAPATVTAERKKYTKDGLIIGMYGRLEKVHDAYLETIKSLLERFPNVTCLLCGANDRSRIQGFIDDNGLNGRLHVLGFVNAHLYGRLFDVFLDSFPVCGGMSGLEVQAKGVPIVHLATADMKEVQYQRLPELTAQTVEEYEEIAARLISDEAYLREASRKTREFVQPFISGEHYARMVEQQLLDAIATNP